MKTDDKPPIHTATVECLGWTLDRTAGLPKSARFTFGQRLDNLTLDALMLVTRAIFSPRPHKAAHLRELNLLLEQLRVLWRLVEQRGWISRQQLVFVSGRLDEIGRMTGGWLKQLADGAERGHSCPSSAPPQAQADRNVSAPGKSGP